MDSSINICTLLTWSLWFAGSVAFLLIAVDLLPVRALGLGFMPFAAGSVLYVRRVLRQMRRSEEAAFELGRMVSGGA